MTNIVSFIELLAPVLRRQNPGDCVASMLALSCGVGKEGRGKKGGREGGKRRGREGRC